MQNVNVTVCVIYLIWLFIPLMCVVSGGSFYQAINFVCTIRVFNKLHSECSDHISSFLYSASFKRSHKTANGTKNLVYSDITI